MSAAARKLPRMCTLVVMAVFVLLNLAHVLFAQTTVGTGSIVRTVSDPSGAMVSGGKVTITNVAAGQVINLGMNSSGWFNSGPVAPGNYTCPWRELPNWHG